MGQMLIFGMGYAASPLRTACARADGTGDDPRRARRQHCVWRRRGAGGVAVGDAYPVVGAARRRRRPVLARYGDAIALAPAEWVGYLSSTASMAIRAARGWTRARRSGGADPPQRRRCGVGSRAATCRCSACPVSMAPAARSSIASAKAAHRIALPDQVFSRVHVDDIAGGVIASFRGPPGVYNLADDEPCHQNRLVDGLYDAGRALAAVTDAGRGRPAAAARPLRREPAGRQWQGEPVARLDARYPTYREGLADCF